MANVGRPKYAKDMHDKAKAEGLHLVTIDINGKYAKKCSGTGQSYLFTEAEADKAWEFLQWLASKRAPAIQATAKN
jgi:hypothetical protein